VSVQEASARVSLLCARRVSLLTVTVVFLSVGSLLLRTHWCYTFIQMVELKRIPTQNVDSFT
jgi:hypothetical protein